MKPFRHINVPGVAEAVDYLNKFPGSSRLIAGGTDLLGVLKDDILPAYPELLINIKAIPGLDYLREDENGLSIGALVKLAFLARSPLVREKYKVLADAARSVGTPQLRNMATVGGNLGQETRCWYYRYPHGIGGRIQCQRKGSGPCLAVGGDNRYHVIMGGKGCFAACPSDLATALAALEGSIKTEGAGGGRIISIGEFFHPLGNALKAGEMIVELQVPPLPAGSRQHWLKYTLREPVDFAVVSVAVLTVLEAGICREARIALGAVAPGPLRALQAEQFLKGKEPIPEVLQEAAVLAVQGAKPLSKNGYKVEIARVLVLRALEASFAGHK